MVAKIEGARNAISTSAKRKFPDETCVRECIEKKMVASTVNPRLGAGEQMFLLTEQISG